jgi:hypothetical protein
VHGLGCVESEDVGEKGAMVSFNKRRIRSKTEQRGQDMCEYLEFVGADERDECQHISGGMNDSA